MKTLPEPSLDAPAEQYESREQEAAGESWAADVTTFASWLETAAAGMQSAASMKSVEAMRKCYEAADLMMAKLEQLAKGFSA